MLLPATTLTDPARPPVASPLLSSSHPLFPEAVLPDESKSEPETPREDASLVVTDTLPDPLLTLEPDLSDNEPPTPDQASPPPTLTEPPIPEAPDVAPAESVTEAPPPLELAPAIRLRAPALPPTAVPEATLTNPLLPDDELPVVKEMAPEAPADVTSALPSTRLPEPELTLEPLVTITDPPTAFPNTLPADATNAPPAPSPAPTTTDIPPERPPVATPD